MRGAIPILRIANLLLVTVNIDLDDTVAHALQNDVLTAIERFDAKGLIVDISGLDIVDSYVARILAETGRMARLMGTQTVLVGIQPEVAATLVRMGFDMGGIRTALNVEEGLELLGHRLVPVEG
ncbi:MAG TPA: STAS domain-containing protein [Minicystis sp.]|nr:STAS domain-containing protein [Minicystis sp.]